MKYKGEERRLLEEYRRRDQILPWNNWKVNTYHPRHPVGNLFHEHNHELLVDILNRLALDLAGLKILDVGSGYGYWLRYFVELGAYPENCMGGDLSMNRIMAAKHKNPAVCSCHLSMAALPFPDGYFDFVMQSVVFSSIRDAKMRLLCASEMYRVLRKGGSLLWIDLRTGRSDRSVSFSEADVQTYFPGMRTVFRRQVHPKYFRYVNGKHAWLAKLMYHFFGSYGCESDLLVFRKPLDEQS
jgi:ubiquinone/menaquinone biosynthesis C-methylase UbiE